MHSLRFVAFSSFAALATIPSLSACDLCTVYNADASRGKGNTGFHLAIAEQFSHSGTLQDNSHEIHDPVGQYRDSSITSLILGYNQSTLGSQPQHSLHPSLV